jgi:hypothetical protein
MNPRRAVLVGSALLLLMAAGACTDSDGAVLDSRAPISHATQASTPKAVMAKSPFTCPVTRPKPGEFVPPAPYPAQYPHGDAVWFGRKTLWTALPPDGSFSATKMPLWWSVKFPGGAKEPKPDVRVTWTRLDGDDPVVVRGGDWTTNGYTPETGWLMMSGKYPPRDDGTPGIFDEGCWRATAAYKGASLSYVFEL